MITKEFAVKFPCDAVLKGAEAVGHFGERSDTREMELAESGSKLCPHSARCYNPVHISRQAWMNNSILGASHYVPFSQYSHVLLPIEKFQVSSSLYLRAPKEHGLK